MRCKWSSSRCPIASKRKALTNWLNSSYPEDLAATRPKHYQHRLRVLHGKKKDQPAIMDAYEHRATSLAERAPGPKMNYVELIQLQAEQVFGNKAKADAWLSQPKTAFGGSSAIELARSEAGYAQVKDALERIDQGYAG